MSLGLVELLKALPRIGRQSHLRGHFGEGPVTLAAVESILQRRVASVLGHPQVDVSVTVVVDEARSGRHVHRTGPAKVVVGGRQAEGPVAVVEHDLGGVAARTLRSVEAGVGVDVPVIVDVGPGDDLGLAGPVGTVSELQNPRRLRHILEGFALVIFEQPEGAPAVVIIATRVGVAHGEVGPVVAVEINGGDPHAIGTQIGQAPLVACVFEQSLTLGPGRRVVALGGVFRSVGFGAAGCDAEEE